MLFKALTVGFTDILFLTLPFFILFRWCSLLSFLTMPAPFIRLLFIHILYHMTPSSASEPTSSSLLFFWPSILESRDIISTIAKLFRAYFGTSSSLSMTRTLAPEVKIAKATPLYHQRSHVTRAYHPIRAYIVTLNQLEMVASPWDPYAKVFTVDSIPLDRWCR